MNRARLSLEGLTALKSILDWAPVGRVCGADIRRRTGMKSGTLYPILRRYEEAGWVKSAWESGNAAKLGRPLCRLYAITAAGRKMVSSQLDRLS